MHDLCLKSGPAWGLADACVTLAGVMLLGSIHGTVLEGLLEGRPGGWDDGLSGTGRGPV
ncbi:hypothetical protein AUP68_12575 [Ilyonectria robusta]